VKLVSITDVFWPNGRTTFEVTWDLSVRKIDDNSCECTNHVTACATEPFLAFIEERGSSGSHDTDAFRAFLGKEGIKPVIPGKSNRKKRIRHAKKDYKKRQRHRALLRKAQGFPADRNKIRQARAKIPFDPLHRRYLSLMDLN